MRIKQNDHLHLRESMGKMDCKYLKIRHFEHLHRRIGANEQRHDGGREREKSGKH